MSKENLNETNKNKENYEKNQVEKSMKNLYDNEGYILEKTGNTSQEENLENINNKIDSNGFVLTPKKSVNNNANSMEKDEMLIKETKRERVNASVIKKNKVDSITETKEKGLDSLTDTDINKTIAENEPEEEFIDIQSNIINKPEFANNNIRRTKRQEKSKGQNIKAWIKERKVPVTIISVFVLLIAISGVVFAIVGSKGTPNLLDPNSAVNKKLENQKKGSSNKKPDFVFVDGITINDIDLSGKTLEEAKEIIKEKEPSFREKLEISVVANNKVAELTENNFSYTYDTEKVLNEAVEYSKEIEKNKKASTTNNLGEEAGKFTIKATLKEDSIGPEVEKIANTMDEKTKQARVTQFSPSKKDKYKYAEGENGFYINKETLESDILIFINSKREKGTINAKVKEVEPKITVDMVKKNIVPLATYSTTSYNTADGTHNMKTALAACNGSIIEPGGIWSFNTRTGDSNLTSKGYRPATVIAGGKYTQGVGGGICQVSTTVYTAALYANMSIVERYNHFWASSYSAAGLDATIDYPGLDLRLKNPTDYQMFFECYMEGRKLVVNIYGYKDSSYDQIATYSKTHDVVSGSNFKASAYRLYYKDGKEIKREHLSTSTYSLTKGHYVVAGDSGTFGKVPNAPKAKEEETKPPATPKPTEAPVVKPTQPPTKPPTKPTQPPTQPPTSPPSTSPPVTDPPATDPPLVDVDE